MYGDRWAVLPLLLVVTAVSALGRTPDESRRETRFWRLWAAGFGCWLVGQGIWWAMPDGGHVLAISADAIFFSLYAFLLPAIESRPDAKQPSDYDQRIIHYTTWSGWLLLGCAFVYFYLLPGLLTQEVYDSWQPTTVGVLCCDLYFFVRLLVRVRRSERTDWAVRYGLLAAAFAAWIVADGLQLVAVMRGYEFNSSWKFVQFVSYLPFVPLLLAILHGRSTAESGVDPAGVTSPAGGGALVTEQPVLFYSLLLPSVHLTLYALGWLDETLHRQREILALGTLFGLAIIMYQMRRAAISERLRLDADLQAKTLQLADANADLSRRVRERTEELVRTNRALQQDIERRTAIERRLLQSQSRNEALIAALPDLLYVLRSDGRVLEAYGRPEHAGRPFMALFSTDEERSLEQVLESCCRKREPEQVPVTRLEGTELRRYECRFVPLHHDEALVLAQDVTRRRQMDELVQQTQQMESLGTLAGGIAHDFNNLLAGIRGNVQLVRESLPEGHPLQANLKVAESNSGRAAKLTDNLLAYAGRGDVALRPLDLRQTLLGMEDLLTATLRSGCRLHLHAGQDPAWVLASEPQITQIMLNLVTNAGEALGEEGGVIWVMLDRHRPPTAANADSAASGSRGMQIRLRVRDEGCGMDPETRRRIFDPFFSTKATGRGLGMAAVLGITTQLGCSVAVDSRRGEGTEVTLLLPEETESRPLPPIEVPGAASGLRRGKMLVADDEEDVRDLMASALGRMGFEVILAADGREALEAFRREREELTGVILDYVMPRMNGTEVARRIRREAPRMLVVLMSGYSEREATRSLLGEQNVHFVHKPFDLDEFAFLLRIDKREDSARA